MSRINFKILTLSWWQWLLILVFLWFISVLWPIKGLLLPQNWWGQSLVVVLNDNEARPCGGFATAYGVLRLPLLSFDVGNSYELRADLGPAPAPLDQVSDRLYFWDLGILPDLKTCAAEFKNGYRANTDETIDRVILVQMSFLENWAKLLGDDTFFADVSREVANVDRHDEASLESRKDPAKNTIKPLVTKTILNPFAWRSFTKLFRTSQQSQAISTGPEIKILEWNLGGAKASRYLRKHWSVDVRETTPGQNTVTVHLRVTHLGMTDEPLSQSWKGGFELQAFGANKFIETEIVPGETWEQTASFMLPAGSEISLTTAPGQTWNTEFSISALPQQTLQTEIDHRESTARWSGLLSEEAKNFSWEVRPDITPPFMTLHTVVVPNVSEEIASKYLIENPDKTYFYGEIHFNELVTLTDDFKVDLVDRDFANPDISQNPVLSSHVLLADQKTLILQFEIEEFQKDERFRLSLEGITDVWGNEYENKPRTLITR